ncbi:hypothetical protein HAX54_049491 [Datura stramonium]|uniref:Uncharacterized protein n=1 Tax=Datura stramonium TaxID=4076 RepID=A0ABS8RR56_DATST|nr:hypothetical protein [Datura stramonium]
MFGLFHLEKNETFRTGDPNIVRIGKSYLSTLMTMVDQPVIEELYNNQEVACRTAAHPFGLGQTYWLARALNRFGGLASPLAVRLDVTPPLVQRLMIVEAATDEWTVVPVGARLNALFAEQLDKIANEIKAIKAVPPAYSELYALYGFTEMRTVSKEAKKAANSLMPIICRYAHAMHTDEQQRKDDLALTLSFTNIERDFRQDYLNSVDEKGLEDFIARADKLSGNVASVTGEKREVWRRRVWDLAVLRRCRCLRRREGGEATGGWLLLLPSPEVMKVFDGKWWLRLGGSGVRRRGEGNQCGDAGNNQDLSSSQISTKNKLVIGQNQQEKIRSNSPDSRTAAADFRTCFGHTIEEFMGGVATSFDRIPVSINELQPLGFVPHPTSNLHMKFQAKRR